MRKRRKSLDKVAAAPKVSEKFDPAKFLETATKGRTLKTYAKREIIFTQGDIADSVFYIKKVRSKSPSCHRMARKPWWHC